MSKFEWDLHLHSTVSDGKLSPSALVAVAELVGLKGMAITDHNTTEGCMEAISEGKRLGIEVICGVELSSWDDKNNNWHILGYFLDPDAKSLVDFQRRYFKARRQRTEDILKKLGDYGYDVDISEFRRIYPGDNASRPHIAMYLVSKGYFSHVQDVFEKEIGNGKRCYIPDYYKLTVYEAAKIIREAGGVPVLAHPMQDFDNVWDVPWEMFKDSGIVGIEVMHPKNKGYMEALTLIAEKFDFLPTGGSDWHGNEVTGEFIIGQFGVESWVIERLRSFNK